MPRFGIVIVGLALVSPVLAQEINRKDLKPGLIAGYTEFSERPQTTTSYRIDPVPAITLGQNESHHPGWSLTSAVQWQGYLTILNPGKYTFSANVQGWRPRVTLIRDKTVLTALQGMGKRPAETLQTQTGSELLLQPGVYQLRVEVAREKNEASIQPFELFWEGPGFRREPVPHYVLGHLEKDRPQRLTGDRAMDQGRYLFEELSCKACHAPTTSGLADRTGPNLTEIGRRTYPGWLDAWLANPEKLRPQTSMPKMFTDDEQGRAERYAVVAYLASLGGTIREAKRVSPNEFNSSVTAGGKLYFTAGCAACHGEQLTQLTQPKPADDDGEVVRPTRHPNDSFYTLGFPDARSVYLLGHVGSKTNAESLARYLADPLATNPHGRMPNMNLSGTEARDLARYLCRVSDDALTKEMPPEPKLKPDRLLKPTDPTAFDKLTTTEQWKALGQQLMTSKGCVNCHTVASGGKPLPKAAPIGTFVRGPFFDKNYQAPNPKLGCLSDRPPATAPVYNLTASQKTALSGFLTNGIAPHTASSAYAARAAFRRFNCLACHTRDGEGGLPSELANQMKLLEKAENADDVSPPTLTGVGHKLRTSWLNQVLTQGGRARPWMTLRMPQYGSTNVGFLAEALPKLEGTMPDDTVGKATFSAANVEAGRLLAGKSGHGCISCHDISGVSGGGTRGPDLATTNQRVRYDWYVRWMHQPQRMVPGTRMPQTFQDGQSLLTAVFQGDGDRQLEALWAYFSQGPGLPLPAGMDPPKGLIVAVKDRPEVLRTFMPDNAGTKAIAVGYPGGSNLVFDAATCRVGYAWSGNFLDASPVWNNRGGSPAKLLGPKYWTGPAVFPWATTESRTPPDFAKRAQDPAYGYQLPEDRFYGGPRRVHFTGYTLDAQGRPTFQYSLSDDRGATQLTLTEKPEPLPVTVAAGLKRTFTYQGGAGPTPWLLVGATAKPPRTLPAGSGVPKGELPIMGTRLVLATETGGVTVVDAIGPEGTMWNLMTQPGGETRVLLRLPEAGPNPKTLTLTTWSFPRDDAELLKGLPR